MKQRQWSSRVEPVIGRTAVRDVTGQQLAEIAQGALRIDSKGNITGGKAAAGNLYRLLHHMFTKALARRLRPLELGHPLDGMEHRRSRVGNGCCQTASSARCLRLSTKTVARLRCEWLFASPRSPVGEFANCWTFVGRTFT